MDSKKQQNVGNLAIIGSRSFNNYSYAKKEILKIIQNNKIQITKIISGGAAGADKIGEIFASKFNIPIEVIIPDWNKGKQSGVIRNTDIIRKSDYVIAFWDGESKGTLDSINKAKRLNKKLFIVDISPNAINEGARLDNKNEYIFDFYKDEKGDILSLQYNRNFITSKKVNGITTYFSFKINKNIDQRNRFNLLIHIKNDLKVSGEYENLLNKSVLGLFNNPNLEVGDANLILIPESSSSLNFDLANKINNKIPNALFLKDAVLEKFTRNYDLLIEKGYKQEAILGIEKKVRKAIVDGKILVVNDFTSEETTTRELNKLLENYAPKEIILFSLIG